jgi:hypothetical protein
MAGLTQAMCTSFKQELMTATHNFTTSTGNTFKIALFRATASIVGTYGAATTNYSNMTANSDEASGTNYTAGGNTLTNVTPTTSGTTALTDFADTTWSSATITASGALIYNSSASNKSVAVLNFGSDKTSTAGDFTIIFPTADASNAIIRIA